MWRRNDNKKVIMREERVMHDEEFGEENVEQVDQEWAEFERVLQEFRERRLMNAAVEKEKKPKKSRRIKAQVMYPCPPSVSEADNYDYSDDDDEATDVESDDGFVSTLVSDDFASMHEI